MEKEKGFLLIGILIAALILMLLAGGFWAFREGSPFGFNEKPPLEVKKELGKLETCLKEAKEARAETCKEMGFTEGNCVGIDFVEDPIKTCYEKYLE